jgi:hypothetical protein
METFVSNKQNWSEPALRKLYALHYNYTNQAGRTDEEFASAEKVLREAIEVMLANHGNTWGDLDRLLKLAEVYRNAKSPHQQTAAPPVSASQPSTGKRVPGAEIYKGLKAVFKTYHYFQSPYYPVALALWTMHVPLFRRFKRTPRLLLRSEIPGEGKTTILDLLNILVPFPCYAGNITAAAVSVKANQQPTPCFLLDEADNLEIWTDPLFRAIINKGYERGSKRIITTPLVDPHTRQRILGEINLHAPMALGLIHDLPPAIMRRSLVLNFVKAKPEELATIHEFDDADAQMRGELEETFQYVVG